MDSCGYETLDVIYKRLCRSRKEEPQENVLKKLQASNSRDDCTVDFSNLTLTATTCSILAEIFRHDVAVVKLIMADCMISEKSLKCLLMGLSVNTCLRKLDLRGNNLKQLAGDALGSFLKSNHFITHLLLEWNCLGHFNSSFANFCDGLATNTALCHLDLRNNQIDHKGAKELATAVTFNKSLKSLDLRWNNIGLSGGRLICDALKNNKTIEKLEICGNDIPVDICDNIETSLFHNRNKCTSSDPDQLQVNALHKEIELIMKGNKKNMESIVNNYEADRSQLMYATSCTSTQVLNLQQALEERKLAMNTLRAKLDMTQANMKMVEQKHQEKEMLIQLARKDCHELVKTHESERNLDRKCMETNVRKLQEQLRDAENTISSLQSKVADSERRAKNQSEEVCLLKKSLSQTECDYRCQMTALEERSLAERKRFCEEMAERERRREEEAKKQLEEAEVVRACSSQRVNQVMSSKAEMQDEIMNLNKCMLNKQTEHDAEISNVRKQLKQEYELQRCQLDEQIRSLLDDKAELQKSLATANGQLREEKSQREAAEIEAKAGRTSLSKVKNQIELRQAEHEQQLQSVRTEMRKREINTQEELNQVSELRATIKKLLAAQDEHEIKFRAAIKEREEVIQDLRMSLKRYEDEADRTREEETRRLDVLHNALMNYMQSSQLNRSTSPQRRSQASFSPKKTADENPL